MRLNKTTKTVAKRTAGAKPKARPRKSAPRPAASPPRAAEPEPLIDCDAALHAACEKLVAHDPDVAGKLAALGGYPPLRRREPGFAGLAMIIVSQQVSAASASAIFGRLEAALAPLEPQSLLLAEEATLRACGLSTNKIKALRAVAEAASNGLDLAGLARLEAEAAHAELTRVKGVGPWTADVFLLFCLGHPDAFPAGDLALQEAARLALGLKKRPDARKLEKIAERWRPLRGVAARMLWAYYRAAKRSAGLALTNA